MFKKIEIWILYLVILFSILFAIGFGVLVRQEIEGITKAGSIDISFLSKPAAYIARLPEQVVISILKPNPLRVNDPWDEDRYFYNQSGFNGTPNSITSYLLLSRYDGDLQEGLVELIDLTNFEVLHTWNPDIDAFNDLVKQVDEFKYLERDSNNSRSKQHHPKLARDGGLLFHDSLGSPLRKIDACSNIIFQNTHDIFHHSIETDSENNIWVPSNIYPQSLPLEMVGSEFEDNAIVQLNNDGEILFEKSVSQIFIDNALEHLLFSVGDDIFDIDPIHLNDIQPVNFDGEYWKKGDVFLSLRHQSMVLLYRPSTNKIIWKGSKPFFHQHDVDILDDHRISIFDNNSKNFIDGDVVDGHNEVIIYNFKTDKYSSYLKDALIDNDVRTITQGRSQILPNGDLFIEDTNYARTLYFNADGSLRWTHVNRADNQDIYIVAWSRILYTQDDIQNVNNFLENKGPCNE
ncbi:arylsulfotransferase family protein [Gammaproteobacteria bacterium]|nr:arylsulfotransferase family protein [Gammaproteobacteria bacterium]